ncbi:hypothetical protein FOL47_000471 [Perkinsus chesapeaki]|uniref:Uncharacterized protein n=1 Tax=Perkinsus chesapeaki TaxID=330153 RepID=A0A7J6MLM1_PERCH|nr:hypothetical protein FOL47_000471 [Perkinsus chesapeaki]
MYSPDCYGGLTMYDALSFFPQISETTSIGINEADDSLYNATIGLSPVICMSSRTAQAMGSQEPAPAAVSSSPPKVPDAESPAAGASEGSSPKPPEGKGASHHYTPGCFDMFFGPKGIGADKARDAQGHEHTREEVNRRLRWKGRGHFPSADDIAIRKAEESLSAVKTRSQSMQAHHIVHFQESVSCCSFGSENPPTEVAHRLRSSTENLIDRPHMHRLPSATSAPKDLIASFGTHHVNGS